MSDTICAKVREREALDQLQEECAELIVAAGKIKRLMDGDPSGDRAAAIDNFVEELADVQLVRDVAIKKLLTTDELKRVTVTVFEKMKRWNLRLKGRCGDE